MTSTMHRWHWQTWQGRPYLTCDLLAPWPHGFFTQTFWPSPPQELVAVLAPGASVHRLKQVHGNRVLSPGEIAAWPEDQRIEGYAQADAVISDGPSQSVWVCSADCTPVLIGDTTTGETAAIHAGWRGTAQKIVPAAVDRMLQRGSQLQDLRVAMGPSIAGAVYQVSHQVAAAVGITIAAPTAAAGPPTPPEPPEEVVARLQEQPNSPVLPDPVPGRSRLDVRQVSALQLEQLGLSQEQIALAPHCTYQDPEHFFSYRRAREKKVQWSGIVSR